VPINKTEFTNPLVLADETSNLEVNKDEVGSRSTMVVFDRGRVEARIVQEQVEEAIEETSIVPCVLLSGTLVSAVTPASVASAHFIGTQIDNILLKGKSFIVLEKSWKIWW